MPKNANKDALPRPDKPPLDETATAKSPWFGERTGSFDPWPYSFMLTIGVLIGAAILALPVIGVVANNQSNTEHTKQVKAISAMCSGAADPATCYRLATK